MLSEMKILTILWAIGLAECDKLDRSYLPPTSSILAGGHPGELNLPLEFPKENYPLSLDSGSDRQTADSSLVSNYPDIAIGINRQAQTVTASPKYFTKRPESSFSKTTYKVPYDFTHTSNLPPVENYDSSTRPLATLSEGYSTTTSPNPNLSYDQYSNVGNVNQNNPQKIIPNFVSNDRVTLPYVNIDQPITDLLSANQLNSSASNNINKYVKDQPNKIGTPESQTSNSHTTPSNITPNSFSDAKYPSVQFGDGPNITPGATIFIANTSYPDKYNNQQTFQSYYPKQGPEDSDGIVDNSQFYNDPIKSGLSLKLKPGQTYEGTSTTNAALPSNTFSSIPVHLSSNQNLQPQRFQAENDRNAVILNYNNILTPEGFAYSFDTSNGIHVDESGTANNGVIAKGSYSFIGDDGNVYSIEYTADENGFLPRGDHLPTAPPIPEAILKGLEQAEKNRQLGIIDDGSYDDAKYGYGRYQGLMSRIPQNKFNNIILNQPGTTENEQNIFQKSDIFTKTDDISDEITTKDDIDVTSNTQNDPTAAGTYDKKLYVAEDNTDFVSKFNGKNQPNLNLPYSVINKNTYNQLKNKPHNKFRADLTMKKQNEELPPSVVQNIGKIQGISVENEYNTNLNQPLHSGYQYNKPHIMLNDNGKNNLQSLFPNIREYPESSDAKKTYSGILISKPPTTSNISFNYKSPKPNAQTIFNDPIITSGNSIIMQNGNIGISKLDTPKFYNREEGKIRNGDNVEPERLLSTLEPKVASTTLRPYHTYNGNGKQRNNYPLSTYGSEYEISTTPLPSEISSSLPPSISSSSYFQTTPTASEVTSTLRPLIASGTNSRRPGYMENIPRQEQNEDFKMSATQPKIFGQRLKLRPGYTGRPNKIPVTQVGFSEYREPEFDISTKPRSQIFDNSRPENFGIQSSTEKNIGEDFSGLKQPQKFDPKHGYYY